MQGYFDYIYVYIYCSFPELLISSLSLSPRSLALSLCLYVSLSLSHIKLRPIQLVLRHFEISPMIAAYTKLLLNVFESVISERRKADYRADIFCVKKVLHHVNAHYLVLFYTPFLFLGVEVLIVP